MLVMSSRNAHSLLSIKQFGFERSYSGRHLTEASDEATIANPVGPKKNDKLTFTARFGTDSKSVAAASPEVILEYFQNPENLSFGASMPSIKVNPTPELLDKWNNACRALGASQPNENDKILQVRTVGVSIPGLTVEWSACIGTKLIMQADTSLPAFEFVLIEDQSSARGIPPLVYIYDKITGSRNGEQQTSKSNRETRFISRIGMKKTKNEQLMVFSCGGTMVINFKIPAPLMIFVRQDKQKSEDRMSKIIGKTIDKQMLKSLGVWENSYAEFVATRR
jgi:hypothetical protein